MMRLFLIFTLLMLAGCQMIRFTDPYEGKPDTQKNSQTEGLQNSVHSLFFNGLNLTPPRSNIENTEQTTYATTCSNSNNENLQRKLNKVADELRPVLMQQGITLDQDQQILWLPITANRFFLTDSPRMSRNLFPVLDELSHQLNTQRDLLITLGVGHVHNPDSDESALTSFRIKSIENYLYRHDVAKPVVFNVAYNDSLPLNAEQIKDGKNRYNKSYIVIAVCLGR